VREAIEGDRRFSDLKSKLDPLIDFLRAQSKKTGNSIDTQQRACRSPLIDHCAPKGHLCCRCECLTTSFSVRCPVVKQSGLGSALFQMRNYVR
jgi:hypothetical protein